MPQPDQLGSVAVVLVAARNPLNIGAAARAMSNFGFLDLRVVNPYEVAFREARSAVGASSLLADARECKTLEEAIADCNLVIGTTAATARDPQQPLLRLEEVAAQVRQSVAAGARVALVFGSEKRGLSNEDMSHCHRLLRIPTREDHGSMNLGQAVAVCLYEFIRQLAPPFSVSPASPGLACGGGSSPAGPVDSSENSAVSDTPGGAPCLADVAKRGSFDFPTPISDPAISNSPGGAPCLAAVAKRGDFDFSHPATSDTLERIVTVLLDCLRESGYLNPATAKDAASRTRRLVLRLHLSQQDAETWLGMLRQMLWKLKSR